MQQQYLDFLYSRRSIRQYTDQPVSEQQLENLLKAGCRAPSSMAKYPCHFIIIRDKGLMSELKKCHEKAPALESAPLAIIVCADAGKSELAWRDDAAAATMNILYAACAQGLGACWHGIYPRQYRVEPISRVLKLPEGIIPYSLITVGYPLRQKAPQQRFESDCLHRDGVW